MPEHELHIRRETYVRCIKREWMCVFKRGEREREREISNEEGVDKKENLDSWLLKKSEHHQEKENEEKKE